MLGIIGFSMITQTPEPRTLQWTREEYYRLAAEGHFQGKRVQLIDGEIIEMAPQGHQHTKTIWKLRRFLESIFNPDQFWVREEKPLNIGRRSDPEPDLAVVEGTPESFTDHPSTALFVAEMADSSLGLDHKKAFLYASALLPEYWLVDLLHAKLLIHRQPIADPSASFGHRYADVTEHAPGDVASLLVRSQAKLEVAELFK
jgi:Uma2 family endonuclease